MEEFIRMAVKNLGIPEGITRSATGQLLQMIQNQANEGDFKQLLGRLPGAADLLKAVPQGTGQETGAGGILRGLVSKAVSAISGTGGATAGVVGVLTQSGVDINKAGPLVSMLMIFMKHEAGTELVGRTVGQIPALKKFAG